MRNIYVNLDDELYEALEAFIAAQKLKPTIKAVVSAAIEEYINEDS